MHNREASKQQHRGTSSSPAEGAATAGVTMLFDFSRFHFFDVSASLR
jgi:hypothetical protein